MFGIGILTVSTSGSQGMRQDISGSTIQEILSEPEYRTIHYALVPDDLESIAKQMINWADDIDIDLIVSTGGTAVSYTHLTLPTNREV